MLRARSPSLTISVNASRTSTRSGGCALRKRNAASALVMVAASGWLTSCAIEAASCPMVVTRLIWASSILSLVEFVLDPLAVGDVIVGFQNGNRPSRWAALQCPPARHHDLRPVTPHMNEFSFPASGGQQLRVDRFERRGEVGVQKSISNWPITSALFQPSAFAFLGTQSRG